MRQEALEQANPKSLSSIDGRSLLIVCFVFVLIDMSTPKFALGTAVAFAAFPFFVMVLLRLPVIKILKRIMILSPFILMVAAANPFIDSRTAFEISGLPVNAGMISASVIIIKSLVSMAAVLILVELLSFNVICESLLRMGVPEILTTQLMLVYRYSFLLSDEAERLNRACENRSFGNKGRKISTASKMIGSLLVRSFLRSERIYKAMLSRGFSGRMTFNQDSKFGMYDFLLVISASAIFIITRILI